ncbi:hypothetical protein JOF29_001022 [Kribbella aluminosa]|uniref:Uncharacterized protein n=1 Tax=Kribbella aluminosa TaxID=416017 RepID=A0ABS4UE64_9ACTN|nr:hypothetical protein [Kribbella aluminosa]MBP2349939.1 hypothetical protein [Kribbella aluminosa]
MMRVMLDDADYCDVVADLMTFDDGAVIFWQKGEEVGRHRQSRIRSLEPLNPKSMVRKIQKARQTAPNAFRQWTEEDTKTLTDMYNNGASLDALTEALGRQEGGIITRLRTIGILLEEDPKPE